MLRVVTLQLKPTKKQRKLLDNILMLSCDLYNAALQERRDAWKLCRQNVNYYQQQRELTEIRSADKDVRSVAMDIAREPLRRINRAFNNFFRRCKSGRKSGFPRFKKYENYRSFGFGPPRVKNGLLLIPKLGCVRFKTSQRIFGDLREATVVRCGERWRACILCDIGPAPQKKTITSAVGIDLGLTNIVTLSDGSAISNPRWLHSYEDKIANAHRIFSRKKKGSRNRLRAKSVLRRLYQRVVDSRRNFSHHLSKHLVSNFDLIAYEKLNIQNMSRSKLGKSILDAAWNELLYQISYKAESAGRYAIAVNPRGTTIICSGCGNRVVKALSERTHSCPVCALTLDRDHNAAINILRLGESLAEVALQDVAV